MEIRHNYSSQVRLELQIGDVKIPLFSIGPDAVVLRQARELPSGPAEIVMTIDDHIRRWSVKLPHGAVPFEDVVAIQCDE